MSKGVGVVNPNNVGKTVQKLFRFRQFSTAWWMG